MMQCTKRNDLRRWRAWADVTVDRLHVIAHTNETGLGCRICRCTVAAFVGHEAGDVDDASVGSNPGVLADKHGGQKIGIEDSGKLIIRRAPQKCSLRDSGAVDEDIEGADDIGMARRNRGAKDGLDIVGLGDVEPDEAVGAWRR